MNQIRLFIRVTSMCVCAYIHPFISTQLLCSIYLCIYLSIDLYLSISLRIILICIIYYSSVEVTNTTVSPGEDAILTCIVATVNNKPEDLTSNIICHHQYTRSADLRACDRKFNYCIPKRDRTAYIIYTN